MRIGYFTERYPAVGQTSIGREIRALEALGQTIVRYALRCEQKSLVDPKDASELNNTRHLLELSVAELFQSILSTFLRSPLAAIKTLWQAATIGQRSDSGILQHLGYAGAAMALAAWCRRDQIQHLHAHFGASSAAIAMFAAELVGIPYSLAVHGPEEFENASLLSLDEKLRRAAFAVCTSSYGRCQLMLTAPQDLWPKLAVIHPGIAGDDIGSDVSALPAEPRFVCVGALIERKAQLVLIEAVRRLRDDGIACHVVLVGDGPMRQAIETAIRKADLQDLVTITGWVPSETVKTEIAQARGLVLPSFAEDMPVAIIEAMATGHPVISTYVGGIPELVTHEKSGWLVPPGEYDALANAMRNLIEASAETLSAFAAAGRTRILQRHDGAKEAAKLQQLFQAARPDVAPDREARVAQAVKNASW